MNRPLKIVADANIPYLRGVLESYASVEYMAGDQISSANIGTAQVLIVRTRTRCDRELLQGSAVRVIYTATIGFDHIDTDYCRTAGIEMVTAAGCNSRGVLQWVGAVLALFAGRDGWKPEQRTLGVVGVGNVGKLVADYAQSWGFRVLRCDPPRVLAQGLTDFYTLEQVAQQADIVSFHVPLVREGEHATYHLAGSEFFEKIATNTLILNSSRGEVVDTQALLTAIDTRGLSCAVDTWEGEPNIDPRLAGLATVATTHIAGYSAQGKANATSIIVRSIAVRFGFPLADWYPHDVVPPSPRPIGWDEMCPTIHQQCDLERETATLKADISRFETLRNHYIFRQEYF